MIQRPPIPSEMKREIRQRCGFGCVLCGMPLYEYEHMLEWAEVQRHVAEEITLLCRQHHGEKTNGLLPKEVVTAANLNPYNKQTGVSKQHLLHYAGQTVRLRIADSCFEYNSLPDGAFLAPLVIDGLPLVAFRIEQGELLLHFIAFNEFNKPIIRIVDNELIYDTTQWDIEWVAQTLTIREGRGRVLLELVFSPPSEIVIQKGRLLCNGIELLVGRNYLFSTNNSIFFGAISTVNCPVGFAIGDPTPSVGTGIVMSGISRYNFDRRKARQFLRSCLNDKRGHDGPV
jgi:trigger factor